MQTIFRTTFGSRLYGTTLPDSDFDQKAIVLPSADQLLLGERPKADTYPKPEGCDDFEFFTLQEFLKHLGNGQTVALDMLFAPPQFWVQMDPLWYDVLNEAPDHLLSKRCGAAIGYARAQSERYSLRGSRITALETVLDTLRRHPKPGANLQDALFQGGFYVENLPPAAKQYVKVLGNAEDKNGMRLEVCGKQADLNGTVLHAIRIFEKCLAEYGDRSREAQAGGADWKALYHAIRIVGQTRELLQTSAITFPRPDAEHLLKIRRGELPVEKVFEDIEQGIKDIEADQLTSSLPEDPDLDWARRTVLRIHKEVIDQS